MISEDYISFQIIVTTTAEPDADSTTSTPSEETTTKTEEIWTTEGDTTTSEAETTASTEPETTTSSVDSTMMPETTIDTTTSDSTTVESTITTEAETTSNVPTATSSESTTTTTDDDDDVLPTTATFPPEITTTTSTAVPTTTSHPHNQTVTTPDDLYPTTPTSLPTKPPTHPTEPSAPCPPLLPINRICSNPAVTFYPHPYDCAKFVRCASGKPFIFRCPDELLWHQKYKTCDWPQNVKCCYGKEVSRCPPRKPLEYICDDGQLYQPHPTYCSRYVKCINNRPTEQRCGNGLFWNNRREVCDSPKNVQCCRYQFES